jgi:uncharacterized protein (UPF0332 family)
VTREQEALLAKARRSLDAARLLHSHAQYGFAAARAYYTMFYLAEALLLGEGLSFSKHSGVHAAFGQHFAKTGRVPSELQRYLIDGMAVRHAGDYSTTPVSEAESDEQMARAERFLQVAERVLGGGSDGPSTRNE